MKNPKPETRNPKEIRSPKSELRYVWRFVIRLAGRASASPFGFLLLLSTLNLQFSTARAQGTAFSYQGQLQNNGSLANGAYNLTFTLFTASTGGSPVAGPVTNSAVVVTGGLFTVILDFGSAAWNGQTNWLQLGVETNGSSTFTTLSPRQRITLVPYAITAGNLDGTVTSASLSGTYGSQLTFSNAANQFTGTFGGNGASLANVNALYLDGQGAGNFWQLGGNNVGFFSVLGSTNNAPLQILVNNERALRLEPTSTDNSPNVIGGSAFNSAASAVSATISGGYANNIAAGVMDSSIGGGNQNIIQASDGAIAGGAFNMIQSAGASYATIGGGGGNTNAGNNATIAGGFVNTIELGASSCTIGGGYQNVLDANYATIAGGSKNVIQAGANFSTIGGGNTNLIDDNSPFDVVFPSGQQIFGAWSTIAGGAQNTLSAGASFIGGGGFNWIQTNAQWSLIGGGEGNLIDTNSFTSSIFSIGGSGLNNISGGFSMIGGGANNRIRTDTSFVGGGVGNLIDLYASSSFISGGHGNSISNSPGGVIGGGINNSIEERSITGSSGSSTIAGGLANQIYCGEAAIGGGTENYVGTNGIAAAIAGGSLNTATGTGAMIPGGENNTATGRDSFAAGSGAMATNDYSFVWSDGHGNGGFGNGTAQSTAPHQFIIGALGGAAINTQPTTNYEGGTCALTAKGGITTDELDLPSGGAINSGGSITCQGSVSAFYGLFNIELDAGSNSLSVIPGTVTVNGTFNNFSDRNAKQDFKPVLNSQILDRVAQLPISEWSYKADAATRHIGPMAQDFHAAFNIGTDDRHIAPIDEGGVALAAIQGLNQKVNEKDVVIQQQSAEIADLKTRLEKLEQLIASMKGSNQ